MTREELNTLMSELAQYQRIAEETAAVIDGLKDKLKGYMTTSGLVELVGDEHKATYKEVTSTRLDTTAIKRDMPDVAKEYTKHVSSMRFTFA